MHPVHYSQAATPHNAGTMMTASGQMIATSSGHHPQQIISGPGKTTFFINQGGYGPTHGNQTNTSQSQLTALQPNILYASAMPVHSSQILNGSHTREILSQPQIVNTQASGTAFNPAQMLGLQAINNLQPGFYQLCQNPIIIYNQPPGMTVQQIQPRMQMHMPAAAALPSTQQNSSFPAIPAPQKLKKLKLLPKVYSPIECSSGASSSPSSPLTTVNALMNQAQSTLVADKKSFTNSPSYSKPMQNLSKSTGMENKAVSAGTEIFSLQKSQAIVTPFVNNQQSCLTPMVNIPIVSKAPSTLIISSSTASSPSLSSTQVADNRSEIKQKLSTIERQQDSACNQTSLNPTHVANNQTESSGIESIQMSVETKIPSPEESQAMPTPIFKIPEVNVPPTLVADIPVEPAAPSTLIIALPTTSIMTVSSLQKDTLISPAENKISSPQKLQAMVAPITNVQQACIVPTPTEDDSDISAAPSLTIAPFTTSVMSVSSIKRDISVSSAETKISSPQKSETMVAPISKMFQVDVVPSPAADNCVVSTAPSTLTIVSSTASVMPTSSVKVDTPVSSVDTAASSVPTVSPVTCQINNVDCNFKPPMPKAHKEVIVNSHQTDVTETEIIIENLKSQHSILKNNLESADNKQLPKAIVKPHVLTHVINGFVIQESSEPFPVSQSPLLNSPSKILPHKKHKSPKENKDIETVSDPKRRSLRAQRILELAQCEFCEKFGPDFKYKYSKRFCSKSCIKQFRKHKTKNAEISASAIQENGILGRRGRKRKRRGRKRLQKQPFVKEENTNATPCQENISTPENESTVSYKPEGESSAPSANLHETLMEVGVSNDAIVKSESDLSPNLSVDWKPLVKENTNAILSQENLSAPRNESVVSHKMEENDSAPSSANLLETLMEVGKSNDAIIKSESDLSQKLSDNWTRLVKEENTNATPSQENLSTPKNESTVSHKIEGNDSAPSSASLHETPTEVRKPNDEVEKSKSALSQTLPSKWTVQEVFQFVQSVTGCTEYADNFKSQEIDGQALLLLNDDHLRTALCMKLGPALKLLSLVKNMEEKLQSLLCPSL